MIAENELADIHTHILPGMDDGSSSVEESLQMLNSLREQGVSTVAVTPHFYADRDNPTEFLKRRQKAVSALKEKQEPGMTVIQGAEVCYYQGVSRTEELPEFTIGDTKLLLLEMPFCDWTDSIINEVYSIQRDRKLTVVMAHIDRYISRKNMKYISDLLYFGVLAQVNASAFIEKKRRKEALNMLQNRDVHFLGSDCHNMAVRPPRIREACDVIEDKLGHEYIRWFADYSKLYF